MRTSGRRLIAIDLDALTDYDTDTDADEEYSEPVVSVTDKDVEPNDSVTSDPEMMKPSDNDSDMSGGQVRDTTREQRSDCESNTGHKSVKIDTRYRKRQIDYKLVDKRTGMSDQKSVLLNETSPEAMEVRIVCFHCEKRYHSMADFRHHYKKRHFKDNKPCAGVKLKLIPKSVDKTSTHKHKHKTKSKTTSSPSPPKESRSKDSKKKLKTKVNPTPISSTPGPSGVIKNEVTVTKTPISSTCSSATSASVTPSPSKPKFLPQCKICTFMPLVDPYNAIDSHMRLEHKITGDTTSHVKVVLNPKAT